jgi:hypothetical protein
MCEDSLHCTSLASSLALVILVDGAGTPKIGNHASGTVHNKLESGLLSRSESWPENLHEVSLEEVKQNVLAFQIEVDNTFRVLVIPGTNK